MYSTSPSFFVDVPLRLLDSALTSLEGLAELDVFDMARADDSMRTPSRDPRSHTPHPPHPQVEGTSYTPVGSVVGLPKVLSAGVLELAKVCALCNQAVIRYVDGKYSSSRATATLTPPRASLARSPLVAQVEHHPLARHRVGSAGTSSRRFRMTPARGRVRMNT